MRVLQLTSAIEEKILAQRRGRDLVAERVAARIVRDVQRRGDAALFYWTNRFDGLALQRKPLISLPWITPRAIFVPLRVARNRASGRWKWNRAFASASACVPSKQSDAISPAEDSR
jgi:hypothetical protein